MDYDQNEVKFQHKPVGLWVSVESDNGYNWKQWCEDCDFRLDRLKYAYEITLVPDAKILHLKTSDEIFDFTKKYLLGTAISSPLGSSYELDWFTVKKDYQGIIIAPYQDYCRTNMKCNWYYGWDCASGCIWDLDAIEDLTLVEEKAEKAS